MKPISTLLFFTVTIFIALQSTAQEAHILKSTNDPLLQKLINEKKPVHFVIDQSANGPVVKFYEQPQQLKQTTITANTSNAAANFHLTKDINTQTDANPANSDYIMANPYAILNNVMYFAADDGMHGSELWRSDGTAAGTYMVKDLQPGINSSSPSEILVANGKLYFVTQPTYAYSGGLWVSDGTNAGTIQLMNFPIGGGPGVNGSYYLTDVSGTVFFLYGSGPQVWKTNGTVQGATMVKDLSFLGYAPSLSAAANGNYYFTMYSGAYGKELWKSDGTDAGTVMVKDISTSTDFFEGPEQLTPFNDKLYFSDDADGTGRKLWYTDGTSAGTQEVAGQDQLTISTDLSYSYANIPFAILNGELYFSAASASTGTELFKYSTINNFSLVKDITPGADGGVLYNITATGDHISFVYKDTDNLQYQLWVTKGTGNNTSLIISYDNYSAFFSNLTYSNGILYFTSNTTGVGNELWESKSTSGAALVKDIYVGNTSSNPLYLTSFQNKLFFNAASKNSGTELWVTDGKAVNTTMIKEINSVSTSYSGPNYFGPFFPIVGEDPGKSTGTHYSFQLQDRKQVMNCIFLMGHQ